MGDLGRRIGRGRGSVEATKNLFRHRDTNITQGMKSF